MATLSSIPVSYDALFIRDEANISNHFGYAPNAQGGVDIVYPIESYDAVQEIIANYDALILAKRLIPDVVARIASLRREKMQAVTIGGVTLSMDTATEAHLASAVLGLQRNPAVLGIDWELGRGDFRFLSREVVFALGDGAFMHVQGCFSYARTLTAKVLECTTAAELEAIDINTGWPNE